MLQGLPSDQPDPEDIKKESDSVKQEDDPTDDELTAADLISQVATAGSVMIRQGFSFVQRESQE